jgi:hypothetical protein
LENNIVSQIADGQSPARLASWWAAVRITARGLGAIFHLCCRIAAATLGAISGGMFTTSRTNAWNSAESGSMRLAASISAWKGGIRLLRVGA